MYDLYYNMSNKKAPYGRNNCTKIKSGSREALRSRCGCTRLFATPIFCIDWNFRTCMPLRTDASGRSVPWHTDKEAPWTQFDSLWISLRFTSASRHFHWSPFPSPTNSISCQFLYKFNSYGLRGKLNVYTADEMYKAICYKISPLCCNYQE
jgi:hypothetical protein